MIVKEQNLNPLGLPDIVGDDVDHVALFREKLSLMDAHPEIRETIGVRVVGNPITVRTVKDPATWVKDQVAGVANSRDKYIDGIQHPHRDPKAGAAESAKAWRNGIADAEKNNSYQKGIESYNLDEAINTAVTLGADALIAGVNARIPKITRAVSTLQPKIAAAKEIVDRMPSSTLAERKAKSSKMIDLMVEIGKS